MCFRRPEFFVRVQHRHRLTFSNRRGEFQIKIIPDAQIPFLQWSIKHTALESDRLDRVTLSIDQHGKFLLTWEIGFSIRTDKIPNRHRCRVRLFGRDERQLNQPGRNKPQLMRAHGGHRQGIIVGNDQLLCGGTKKAQGREYTGEQAGAKHFLPWRNSPVLAKTFQLGFCPHIAVRVTEGRAISQKISVVFL
jgi:hypothetical protein